MANEDEQDRGRELKTLPRTWDEVQGPEDLQLMELDYAALAWDADEQTTQRYLEEQIMGRHVPVGDDAVAARQALNEDMVKNWRSWTPQQLVERSAMFDELDASVSQMRRKSDQLVKNEIARANLQYPDLANDELVQISKVRLADSSRDYSRMQMAQRVRDESLEIIDPEHDFDAALDEMSVGHSGRGSSMDPVFRVQMDRFSQALSEQMADGYTPDKTLMSRLNQMDPDQTFLRSMVVDRMNHPEHSDRIREHARNRQAHQRDEDATAPEQTETELGEGMKDLPNRQAQHSEENQEVPQVDTATDEGTGDQYEDDVYTDEIPIIEDPSERLRMPPPSTSTRMTGDWQEDLRRGTADALSTFDQNIRSSKHFGMVGHVKEKRAELDEYHRTRASMMFTAVLSPLQGGVRPSSVVEAASMYAAAYMMSPSFKQYTDEMKEGAQDRITNALNKRAMRAKGVEEGTGKPMNAVWRHRLERMASKDRGGRPPYDVMSASVEELAINDDAFLAMRQPGADLGQVSQEREARIKALYTMAKDDGISEEALSASTRRLVGQRIRHNPAMAGLYSETSHDGFQPVGEKTVVGPNGESKKVWDGGFRDKHGNTITGGSFSVRPPMDGTEHLMGIQNAMTAQLASSRSVEDLDRSMVAYGMAWKQVSDPEFADRLDGMNQDVAARVNEGAALIGAMRMDGIDAEECREIYISAFANTLETLEQAAPDVAQRWRERCGENWKEQFQTMAADPDAQFRAESERASRASYEAGPDFYETVDETVNPRTKAPGARPHGGGPERRSLEGPADEDREPSVA